MWLSRPFSSTRSSSISRVPRYRTFNPRRCSAAVRVRPSIGTAVWSRKSFSYHPGQTHVLHQDGPHLFNPAPIQEESHHSWNLMRQQKSCSVPQQQPLLVNLGSTLRGEPNTCSMNTINEYFLPQFMRKTNQKAKFFKHNKMQMSQQPNARESYSVLLIYNR